MPTSFYHQIPVVLDIIFRLSPKSVLDIGVGFGKYGFLLREYLELWNENIEEYGKWKIRIDGIEAFKKYITPCHRFIYDNIYTGKAEEVVKNLNIQYDLALLIDVIEHLEKDTGKELLHILREKARNILIATPKFFVEQESVYNNEFEKHRSHWMSVDFKGYGDFIIIPDKLSLIAVIGEDAVKLKKLRLKKLLRVLLPF